MRKLAKTHQRPFLSHLEALQKSCQEGLPLSNRDRRKPYSVALARPSRVVVDVLQILIFSIVFDVVLVTMVSSGSSAPMPDFGTAPLRLLSTGFGYLNFLVRSCREPFGGDQNASICLISKQSEQLRLFLVGFFKC